MGCVVHFDAAPHRYYDWIERMASQQQPSVTGGTVASVPKARAAAPRPMPSPPPGSPPEDAWESHPIRKISLYFCLATLFLRLSVLPEIILSVTHVNTYLLYIAAPPAILSALLMGSVRRTFQARAAFYWMAFFAWMVLATPFSSWQGGSAARVFSYARVDGIFLVLVGGMAVTWNEVRSIFRTFAAAAVVNLASARIFQHVDNGRISLQSSGTIGNSNDLAAHLLLMLPFLMFFMIGKGRPIVVRIAMFGLMMYGLWIILGTASRGALIALVVVFLYIFFHASLPQKFILVVAACAIALVAIASLPARTLNRLSTLFGGTDVEAIESAESREYLFKTSVKYTFEHPLFGVGPDQFSSFEGKSSMAQGEHGTWHATHCAFTQVSSECGIPAFIFFTAGIVSALLLVVRTYRKAKREGFVEIANGCYCYLLSMTGYMGALIFLADAYTFHLPAMVGFAISISLGAARTMQSGPVQPAPIPAAPVLQRVARRG